MNPRWRPSRARTRLGRTAATAVAGLPLLFAFSVQAQEASPIEPEPVTDAGQAAPDAPQRDPERPDTDAPGAERKGSRDDVKSAGSLPAVATSVNRKAFFKSKKPAKLTYSVTYRNEDDYSRRKTVTEIELLRRKNGEKIETWKERVRDPKKRTVKWKGTKKDGKLGTPGKYKFRLRTLVDDEPVKASSERVTVAGKGGDREERGDGGRFNFYTHHFPVLGDHNYGGKGARFGAGRDGHSHQGQDVFAKCGTPLVAARGGNVQANQFQKAAGFYLVIDGAKTDVDYAYLHMKKRSKLKDGDRVKTGEKIGKVGDSGNASGCHLHFELWKKGWYEGGKPYDPKKSLKNWDSFS